MFKPDDPLKPRDAVFDQTWHAQTLALADTLVQGGHFTANDWAEALGAKLKDAAAIGQPDTTETYYHCAINALEILVAQHTVIDPSMLKDRKSAWTHAYHTTPHGQPVNLPQPRAI